MTSEENQNRDLPTEEGRLVVQLSKALFVKDIDLTFRTLGEYMDRNHLKVSAKVLQEYRFADRIREL